MNLKKLISDYKLCRKYPETRRFKWCVQFADDDRDYLFAVIPTICIQPRIYRYPNIGVVDIWWLTWHVVIGKWVDKEKGD